MKAKKQETKNPPDEVIQVQKRICSWAMTSSLVVALIFIVIDEKAIAKGLLLGTLFSIINFVLLGKSIPLALGQSSAKIGFVGLVSILARYVLLAIPLIMAVKLASFNFFSVVIGIFAVQIVTLVDYMIIKPFTDGK